MEFKGANSESSQLGQIYQKDSHDFGCFLKTHLPLLDSHGLASGRRLLVDAGQEVLGDPQGVLQKRVVWVAGGCVFEQVLEYSSGRK